MGACLIETGPGMIPASPGWWLGGGEGAGVAGEGRTGLSKLLNVNCLFGGLFPSLSHPSRYVNEHT